MLVTLLPLTCFEH